MATDEDALRRMKYFNSQLLDETDFRTEQDYHVGMRRRLNRSVHTWGVAGTTGLRVGKLGDRSLQVGAGLAIDSLGREIVLPEDLAIDLDAVRAQPRAELFLTLAYAEAAELPVQDAGTTSAVNFRRTHERPAVGLPERRPADDGSVILLASVRLDAGGNVAEIDNRVRTFAGSVFDPQADLAARSLAVAAAARIGGPLDVQHGARTGEHPAAGDRALYVTSDLGTDHDGVEFRHSDGTQGIGIGSNTLYAAGSAADQDLHLKPRGAGRVAISGRLDVTGTAGSAGAIEFRVAGGTQGMGLDADSIYAAGSQPDQDMTLRPRGKGRVFVVGDTHVQGNLTATPRRQPVVTGPQGHPAMRIVYGLVLDNAQVLSGAGFDVSKPPGRPGLFDILFRPPFASRPSATVTQVFPAPDLQRNAQGGVATNDGGDPRDNAVIVGIETTMMRVKVGGATGLPADRHFSFIVVGPQ